MPVTGGEPVRLTGDGAYSDLQVARDGSALYALRSGYDSPAAPVRLDPEAALQDPTVLPNPGTLETLPGTLHEVRGDRRRRGRASSRGSSCPRAPRPRTPHRCCCGSTAGR